VEAHIIMNCALFYNQWRKINGLTGDLLVHLFIVLVLILGGAVAAWVGLVETIKLSFLASIIAWGAVSIGVFQGKFTLPAGIKKEVRPELRTVAHSSAVMLLLIFGAGATWVGFVEDIKIAMLVALVAWLAGTFLAFRGSTKREVLADAAENAVH
jgi:hypothetical protein